MLYDVLAPGYHSPLTKTQIAELFQARRLKRNTRCKLATEREWRTIDELFPLLKYHTPWSVTYEPEEPRDEFRFRQSLVATICVGGGVLTALLFYLYFQPEKDRITTVEPVSVSPQLSTGPAAPPVRQPQQQWQTNQPVVTTLAPTAELPRLVDNRQAQLAAQQREAEERQRRQVELARRQEEQNTQEQKARGQDLIIPLDQDMMVTLGGGAVRVKIHDNDVTSFDVWINGAWRREVPKKKGVSHSGTDETLIYDSGRARLFYVWEPSGKLNHCLLRVRDS